MKVFMLNAANVPLAKPILPKYYLRCLILSGMIGDVLCRDVDDLQQVLNINVVGTFAVTKAFLPLLKAGHKRTIVNISSDAACLTLMYSMIHAKDGLDAGKGLSYKASKCAVNMRKLPALYLHCGRSALKA